MIGILWNHNHTGHLLIVYVSYQNSEPGQRAVLPHQAAMIQVWPENKTMSMQKKVLLQCNRAYSSNQVEIMSLFLNDQIHLLKP